MRQSGRRYRGNRLFLNLLNTDSSPITSRCLTMPTGSFSPISPLQNAGPRLEKEKYATRRLSTRHSDTGEMGRLRKTTIPSESALHGWPKEDSGPRTHKAHLAWSRRFSRVSLPPPSSRTGPGPGRLRLSPSASLSLCLSGSLAPSASVSLPALSPPSLSRSLPVSLSAAHTLSVSPSLSPTPFSLSLSLGLVLSQCHSGCLTRVLCVLSPERVPPSARRRAACSPQPWERSAALGRKGLRSQRGAALRRLERPRRGRRGLRAWRASEGRDSWEETNGGLGSLWLLQ